MSSELARDMIEMPLLITAAAAAIDCATQTAWHATECACCTSQTSGLAAPDEL